MSSTTHDLDLEVQAAASRCRTAACYGDQDALDAACMELDRTLEQLHRQQAATTS